MLLILSWKILDGSMILLHVLLLATQLFTLSYLGIDTFFLDVLLESFTLRNQQKKLKNVEHFLKKLIIKSLT